MKRNNTNSFNCKVRTKGFTLVELMISMVLGLGLLGGLMAMYLGSQESDKTRTELSDMDVNATVALQALRKVIQHAGYGTVAVEPLNKSFHTESDGAISNPDCRDGKKLIVSGLDESVGLLNPPTGLSNYTKDSSSGDIITVIHRPDNPDKGALFRDCAGGVYGAYDTATSIDSVKRARLVSCSSDTTIKTSNGMPDATDAKVYSAFYLRQETGEPKQLVCYGSRSTDAAPYEIADNIENMQFMYGVRKDNTKVYKKADDITVDEWLSVNTVQVAILVGSDNQNLLENPSIRTYDLLDSDNPVIKSATDKRIYKEYSTTIYLHNIGMK